MKCIKLNNGLIKRVSDNEANRLTNKKLAIYISKEEYKKHIKPVEIKKIN